MDFSTVVTGAGKGAAAGMALGPIGAAAGALLGAAPGLLDALGIHLFGSDGEAVAASAVAAVQAVTGKADPRPADVAGLSPGEMAQLRVQLAQIAAGREAARLAAEQAERVSMLADITSARTQTVTLSAQKSAIAWGSPVLSAIVLGTFGAMLGTVLSHAVPAGSEALANVMLGTLAAMATQVANYWLGSSAGSRSKDDALATAQTALANSTPVR